MELGKTIVVEGMPLYAAQDTGGSGCSAKNGRRCELNRDGVLAEHCGDHPCPGVVWLTYQDYLTERLKS